MMPAASELSRAPVDPKPTTAWWQVVSGAHQMTPAPSAWWLVAAADDDEAAALGLPALRLLRAGRSSKHRGGAPQAIASRGCRAEQCSERGGGLLSRLKLPRNASGDFWTADGGAAEGWRSAAPLEKTRRSARTANDTLTETNTRHLPLLPFLTVHTDGPQPQTTVTKLFFLHQLRPSRLCMPTQSLAIAAAPPPLPPPLHSTPAVLHAPLLM